jgi:DNA-binding transcriptional regulator YhcF (GntR family)
VEFREKQAIYLQIADSICESILSKRYREGEKIPSVRELATSIEVNPNTVMRTYLYLQDKGIIYNRRGIGYFVANEGYKKTLAFKKEIFIKQDLPIFFRSMDLLKIDFESLKEFYEKQKI